MATRRFFDGAQIEIGSLPLEAAAIVAFLVGCWWGIKVTII